jgi:hypothetical protein
MNKPMNYKSDIEQLATEIVYAQDKKVELTTEDWVKKIEQFLLKTRKDDREAIIEMVEDIIEKGIDKYGTSSWDNVLWHIKKEVSKLKNL